MNLIFLAVHCERVLTFMADEMFALLSHSRLEAAKACKFLPELVSFPLSTHKPQPFSELLRPIRTLLLNPYDV